MPITNKLARSFFLIAVILFAFGCAGPQPDKIELNTSAKPVQSIALLEIDEIPEYVALNMSGAPFLFGVIGALISANSDVDKSKRLTLALNDQNLILGKTLTDLLEQKLTEKGYTVTRIANAREKPGHIVTDYSKIRTDADAIFDVIFTVSGYVDRGIGKPYRPIVASRGQLISTSNYEIRYLNVVNYGYKLASDEWVHIPETSTVEFTNFDTLMNSPEQAANALLEGIKPIANEFTREF